MVNTDTNQLQNSGSSLSQQSIEGENSQITDKNREDKTRGKNEDTTCHNEGKLTKQIEEITTTIPSGTFLSAALSAVGLSALLHMGGRRSDANFVGQWVPTILILGLYNKMVKLHGSES